MSDTHDDFLEGMHAMSHRSHKVHNLRAASGYPLQYGIGAYGSPTGAVTGVQVPGDNDSDDKLSPDQFGNVSGTPDADGDYDGTTASAGAGGSGTSGTAGGTT